MKVLPIFPLEATAFQGTNLQTSSLSALLLCNDALSLRVLHEQLQVRGITRQTCANVQRALEAMAMRRYDLLFVDLDTAGKDWFVSFFEARACLQNTVVVAIASNGEVLAEHGKTVARFSLQKPLLAQQVKQAIDAAYKFMLPSKLPAFRYTINMSVLALLLNEGKEKKLPNATLRNISVTGAGIKAPFTMPVGETVSLHFYMPDYGRPFYAVGKVIWSDSLGQCGIRFHEIPERHFSWLRSWLAAKAAEYLKLSRQPAIPLAGSIS